MTIQEAHVQLNLRIDKIDSAAYDQVLSEEVDVYLGLATRRFIKERFELRSNKFQLGFEQSIKRIEDLRHLLKETEVDSTVYTIANVEGTFIDQFVFPADYFLPVKGSVSVFFNEDGIAYTVSADKRTPTGVLDTNFGKRVSSLRPAQQQDVLSIATSPFNGSRIKSPLYVIQGTSLQVYTNKQFIADKLYLTYVRVPANPSLSGNIPIDLPDMLHDEVIDMAAKMILADINTLNPSSQQTLTKTE